MSFINTEFLANELRRTGFITLAELDTLPVDTDSPEYKRHLAELKSTSKEPQDIIEARAAYRYLTFDQAPRQHPQALSVVVQKALIEQDARLTTLLIEQKHIYGLHKSELAEIGRYRTDTNGKLGQIQETLGRHNATVAALLGSRFDALEKRIEGFRGFSADQFLGLQNWILESRELARQDGISTRKRIKYAAFGIIASQVIVSLVEAYFH